MRLCGIPLWVAGAAAALAAAVAYTQLAAPQGKGKRRKNRDGKCPSYPRMAAGAFPPQAGAVRVFSREELSRHNGDNCSAPLLLAIVGEVYDVGPGKHHYDPGGSYAGFAGRDASRSFVTGKFNGTGLRPELDGLLPGQIASVMEWRAFYRDHKPEQGMEKYHFVGLLEGSFFDSRGAKLPALAAAEEQFAAWQRSDGIRSAFEELRKACNSRTESKHDYFELWCEDRYHGKGTVPFHMYYSLKDKQPEEAEWSKCVCATPEDVGRSSGSTDSIVYRFVPYSDCIGGASASRCRRPKTAQPP